MRGSLVHPSLGVCLFFGLLAPCLAQTEPLAASGEAGSLVLVQTGDTARLRFPDGGTLDLSLPPEAELSALAVIETGETGWIAAGSSRSPEGGRQLFLLRGDRGRAVALPPPPAQEHRVRRTPVLFTRAGRLSGLAWLEGDDRRSLAVRAADWRGGRFAAPSWVSRPGPGSQLALSGAGLADGSWLLAWSAYDGQDDEVVWSRRKNGAWSPVRPASDNAVPDITPHLTAAGDGALLAWSRYRDGHYRVRLSRFADGGFAPEAEVGEPGSLHPRLSADDGRVVLTYWTVLPRAATVAELDVLGRVLRRSSVPREALLPP